MRAPRSATKDQTASENKRKQTKKKRVFAGPYVPEENEKNCAVCFEEITEENDTPGEGRETMPCGHNSFHFKCIYTWVMKENKKCCPVCRGFVDIRKFTKHAQAKGFDKGLETLGAN